MPHGNRLRRLRPIRRIISIGCGDFQPSIGRGGGALRGIAMGVYKSHPTPAQADSESRAHHGRREGVSPPRGVKWSRGESNRQAPPKSRRKGDRLTTRAAQGAARRAARGDMRVSERNITTRLAAPAESDITNEPSFTLLARLVAAWPDLPAEVRAQIAEALRKATDGAA